MNEKREAGRLVLRWGVAATTVLPILVSVVLVVLFETGRLGRCDGIPFVGMSLVISAVFLLAALVGTGLMITDRRGEPVWILLVVLTIQLACLTLAILPFVG